MGPVSQADGCHRRVDLVPPPQESSGPSNPQRPDTHVKRGALLSDENARNVPGRPAGDSRDSGERDLLRQVRLHIRQDAADGRGSTDCTWFEGRQPCFDLTLQLVWCRLSACDGMRECQNALVAVRSQPGDTDKVRDFEKRVNEKRTTRGTHRRASGGEQPGRQGGHRAGPLGRGAGSKALDSLAFLRDGQQHL